MFGTICIINIVHLKFKKLCLQFRPDKSTNCQAIRVILAAVVCNKILIDLSRLFEGESLEVLGVINAYRKSKRKNNRNSQSKEASATNCF